MLSFWELVLSAIRQKRLKINTDPGLVEVDYHEEVSELNIELAREHNHMKPGPDGVVGEAMDVNMMTIHLALTREPELTEEVAVSRAIPKLEKWLGCKIELPPPCSMGFAWQPGPALKDGVSFRDGQKYLTARKVGDERKNWLFDLAFFDVIPSEIDGEVSQFNGSEGSEFSEREVYWYVPVKDLLAALPDPSE